jgi:hypothetical protein
MGWGGNDILGHDFRLLCGADDVATGAMSLSKRSKSITGFKTFKTVYRCVPFKTVWNKSVGQDRKAKFRLVFVLEML